jgi:hypothetical protein
VPDAIAVLLRALLRAHPQEVSTHLAAGCEECRRAPGEPRWGHLLATLPDDDGTARAPELVTGGAEVR